MWGFSFARYRTPQPLPRASNDCGTSGVERHDFAMPKNGKGLRAK
jgi:hypothetical protein